MNKNNTLKYTDKSMRLKLYNVNYYVLNYRYYDKKV